MKALVFTLILREPVLISQTLDGDPNSAISHGYIPGSTIRGVLAHRYQIQKNLQDMAAEPDARRLFFDARYHFLNAYPVLPGGNYRMLPMPRSWFVEKEDRDDDEIEVEDAAVWATASELKRPERIGDDFALNGDEYTYRFSARREISVHNASDNRRRKKAGESQVFRYEALASGQRFFGAIVPAGNEQEELLSELKDLLGSSVLLGGSHTGGYGLVDIETSNIQEWQEYTSEDASDRVSITLLSDVVLPPAQPTEDILQSFARLVGLSHRNEFESVYWQPHIIGGFNRKWGLPLPQRWTIAAGSVFVLPLGKSIKMLGSTGIGELREDGFGRVAVNLYTQGTRKLIKVSSPNVTKPSELSSQAKEIAKRIADHLLRQQLENALVDSLMESKLNFTHLPSKTQLNRLRVEVRQTLLRKDTSAVKTYFENLKDSRKFWSKARLNSQPLDQWVLDCAEFTTEQLLRALGLPSQVPEIWDQKANDVMLITEIKTRYIDGVMKLAVKKLTIQDGGKQ